MARGEPRWEKPGPPKGHAYGIAAVTQALHGLEFPASKQDVLRTAGSQVIEYRKGQPLELRPVLEKAPADEFPSMAQVVQAVSDELEQEGISGPH